MKQLVVAGLATIALFGCAGRIDLPFFWCYLGLAFGGQAWGSRGMDSGLKKERLAPGAGGRDRHGQRTSGLFFIAHFIIAGLDVGRYHWSDSVPLGMQILGLMGLAGSMALSFWAMKVNRFYSPVVRLQTERGQHLITDGPYRWIRHPGYLATLCSLPASGLALGSWWSFAPLTVVLALLIRRVLIEDRFLHEELDGYPEYARRVRCRLVPIIW